MPNDDQDVKDVMREESSRVRKQPKALQTLERMLRNQHVPAWRP